MIRVYGQVFVKVGELLGVLEATPRTVAGLIENAPNIFKGTDGLGRTIKTQVVGTGIDTDLVGDDFDDHYSRLKDRLAGFPGDCERLGLPMSKKSAESFVELLELNSNEKRSMREIGLKAGELKNRLTDELSDQFFFFLDAHSAEMISQDHPFGEEVTDRLPGVAFDSVEASKALGFERYTASVFHLMRVVEISVQEFARILGVKLPEDQNWQILLDQVNSAIRKMDAKAAKTKTLAALSAHLYNVKLAWRNEVMHPKATYTQEEAEDIMKNVRAFVRALVAEMRELASDQGIHQ